MSNRTLYLCDHEKNTRCRKRSCYHNPQSNWRFCRETSDKDMAKFDADGNPIIANLSAKEPKHMKDRTVLSNGLTYEEHMAEFRDFDTRNPDLPSLAECMKIIFRHEPGKFEYIFDALVAKSDGAERIKRVLPMLIADAKRYEEAQ